MDSGQLRTLSSELRSKASEFTQADKDIQQSTDNLTNKAIDLTQGPEQWAGKASQAFQSCWKEFQIRKKNATNMLNEVATIFTKLATSLDSAADQYDGAMARAMLMDAATVGLVIVDVLQAGLDPITDTATVGAGGDAAVLEEQAVTEAEQAALEADQVAATELDQLTTDVTNDLINTDMQLTEDDSTTLYAKGNSNIFKNPINMSMESTDANMPPGVNNEIGRSYIQQIENSGVRVEWNRAVQVDAENSNALAFTDNRNFDPENGSPAYVVVALSPDATNAAVYEEYLHV